MENQKMPEYETIRAAVAGEKWAVEKKGQTLNKTGMLGLSPFS